MIKALYNNWTMFTHLSKYIWLLDCYQHQHTEYMTTYTNHSHSDVFSVISLVASKPQYNMVSPLWKTSNLVTADIQIVIISENKPHVVKKTTNTLNTKSPSTFWFFVYMISRCYYHTSVMFKAISAYSVNFSFTQQSVDLCNRCTCLVQLQMENTCHE